MKLYRNHISSKNCYKRCVLPSFLTFIVANLKQAFLAGSEDLCELVRELLSAGAYEPWIQVSGWVGVDA